MKKLNVTIMFVLCLILPALSMAQVQPYTGGIGVGSMAPTGLNFGMVYLPVTAGQLNDADGDKVSSLDIGMGDMATEFDLNMQAVAFNCTWVSQYELLGGTYSASAILPYVASKTLSFVASAPDGSEIPLMDVDASGLLDLAVTPIALGWKLEQSDISAALSINIPTGDIEAGAANRWSFMPNVGGTYYFDKEHTLSASSKITVELNGAQQEDDLDLTAGNDMIIEWGVGKLIIPFGRFGIIGYSDFQLNEETGADLTTTELHSSHSIGGEYSMFIPPANFGVMVRVVSAMAANDAPPTTIAMVGMTKVF